MILNIFVFLGFLYCWFNPFASTPEPVVPPYKAPVPNPYAPPSLDPYADGSLSGGYGGFKKYMSRSFSSRRISSSDGSPSAFA